MNAPRIAGQPSPGHTPSFRYAQTAPGYAACVTCGRAISIGQLAGERCPGAARKAVAA